MLQMISRTIIWLTVLAFSLCYARLTVVAF